MRRRITLDVKRALAPHQISQVFRWAEDEFTAYPEKDLLDIKLETGHKVFGYQGMVKVLALQDRELGLIDLRIDGDQLV